jgi:hypothetical protein
MWLMVECSNTLCLFKFKFMYTPYTKEINRREPIIELPEDLPSCFCNFNYKEKACLKCTASDECFVSHHINIINDTDTGREEI